MADYVTNDVEHRLWTIDFLARAESTYNIRLARVYAW